MRTCRQMLEIYIISTYCRQKLKQKRELYGRTEKLYLAYLKTPNCSQTYFISDLTSCIFIPSVLKAKHPPLSPLRFLAISTTTSLFPLSCIQIDSAGVKSNVISVRYEKVVPSAGLSKGLARNCERGGTAEVEEDEIVELVKMTVNGFVSDRAREDSRRKNDVRLA